MYDVEDASRGQWSQDNPLPSKLTWDSLTRASAMPFSPSPEVIGASHYSVYVSDGVMIHEFDKRFTRFAGLSPDLEEEKNSEKI
jgi:hypothetical protein